jgi:hypothetical protein
VFHTTPDSSFRVNGKDAVPFLSQSNVNRLVLRNIWTVADPENVGHLTQIAQLWMILRLVALAQCSSVVVDDLDRALRSGETPAQALGNTLQTTADMALPLPIFQNIPFPDGDLLTQIYLQYNESTQNGEGLTSSALCKDKSIHSTTKDSNALSTPNPIFGQENFSASNQNSGRQTALYNNSERPTSQSDMSFLSNNPHVGESSSYEERRDMSATTIDGNGLDMTCNIIPSSHSSNAPSHSQQRQQQPSIGNHFGPTIHASNIQSKMKSSLFWPEKRREDGDFDPFAEIQSIPDNPLPNLSDSLAEKNELISNDEDSDFGDFVVATASEPVSPFCVSQSNPVLPQDISLIRSTSNAVSTLGSNASGHLYPSMAGVFDSPRGLLSTSTHEPNCNDNVNSNQARTSQEAELGSFLTEESNCTASVCRGSKTNCLDSHDFDDMPATKAALATLGSQASASIDEHSNAERVPVGLLSVSDAFGSLVDVEQTPLPSLPSPEPIGTVFTVKEKDSRVADSVQFPAEDDEDFGSFAGTSMNEQCTFPVSSVQKSDQTEKDECFNKLKEENFGVVSRDGTLLVDAIVVSDLSKELKMDFDDDDDFGDFTAAVGSMGDTAPELTGWDALDALASANDAPLPSLDHVVLSAAIGHHEISVASSRIETEAETENEDFGEFERVDFAEQDHEIGLGAFSFLSSSRQPDALVVNELPSLDQIVLSAAIDHHETSVASSRKETEADGENEDFGGFEGVEQEHKVGFGASFSMASSFQPGTLVANEASENPGGIDCVIKSDANEGSALAEPSVSVSSDLLPPKSLSLFPLSAKQALCNAYQAKIATETSHDHSKTDTDAGASNQRSLFIPEPPGSGQPDVLGDIGAKGAKATPVLLSNITSESSASKVSVECVPSPVFGKDYDHAAGMVLLREDEHDSIERNDNVIISAQIQSVHKNDSTLDCQQVEESFAAALIEGADLERDSCTSASEMSSATDSNCLNSRKIGFDCKTAIRTDDPFAAFDSLAGLALPIPLLPSIEQDHDTYGNLISAVGEESHAVENFDDVNGTKNPGSSEPFDNFKVVEVMESHEEKKQKEKTKSLDGEDLSNNIQIRINDTESIPKETDEYERNAVGCSSSLKLEESVMNKEPEELVDAYFTGSNPVYESCESQPDGKVAAENNNAFGDFSAFEVASSSAHVRIVHMDEANSVHPSDAHPQFGVSSGSKEDFESFGEFADAIGNQTTYECPTHVPTTISDEPEIKRVMQIREHISRQSDQLPESIRRSLMPPEHHINLEECFDANIGMEIPLNEERQNRAKRCAHLLSLLTIDGCRLASTFWEQSFTIVKNELKTAVLLLEEALSVPSDEKHLTKSALQIFVNGLAEYVRVVRSIVATVGDLLMLDPSAFFTVDTFSSSWQSVPLLHDALEIERLWKGIERFCESLGLVPRKIESLVTIRTIGEQRVEADGLCHFTLQPLSERDEDTKSTITWNGRIYMACSANFLANKCAFYSTED